MDSKSWGRVFREIREMKNLSLAKVAGDYENSPYFITSKQQVSRFELGKSDITLTKNYWQIFLAPIILLKFLSVNLF